MAKRFIFALSLSINNILTDLIRFFSGRLSGRITGSPLLLIHSPPRKSNFATNSIKSSQTKSHGPKSDLFQNLRLKFLNTAEIYRGAFLDKVEKKKTKRCTVEIKCEAKKIDDFLLRDLYFSDVKEILTDQSDIGQAGFIEVGHTASVL